MLGNDFRVKEEPMHFRLDEDEAVAMVGLLPSLASTSSGHMLYGTWQLRYVCRSALYGSHVNGVPGKGFTGPLLSLEIPSSF